MSAEPTPRASSLPAPLRAMRPRQWVKNVLVLAAPVAAGSLFQPAVALNTLWAVIAFCLISASVYLINDVRDIESDRLHPKKRLRPIAAGEFRVRNAIILAVTCLVASLALSFFVAPLLSLTVGVYWALQVGYSLYLKNEPIIDLAMVTAGFLLRAVAGGVASSIELSQWFLLVASFGSLFMVAGKRYSEIVELGPNAGTRASLARYSESYLRFVWIMACTAVMMSYALWAFEQQGAVEWLGVRWHAVSIAPFTLALLRYAYVVDRGDAGEPEDVVLKDRVLQVLGVVWVIPVAIGVFT